MKRLAKNEAEKEIKKAFCRKISPKEVKKVKKLAMKYNIKLGKLRKKFCKKCYSTELKVKSVKKGMKTIECKNCEQISRWKLKD